MRRLMYGALLLGALASSLTGCNKNRNSANASVTVINNPTGPTPTTVSITGVRLVATYEAITLNKECASIDIALTATVDGPGAEQNVEFVLTESPSTGRLVSSSSNAAVLLVRTNGLYIVTAKAVQNREISGSITIRVFGDCGGTNPPGPGPPNPGPPTPPTPPTPPPGDTFKVSFQPHGGSGLVGSLVTLRASCKKNDVETSCDSAAWTTSNSSKVEIVGTNIGSTITIRYAGVGSSDVMITWQGAHDSATFTGTAEPPPPPPPPPPPTCSVGAIDYRTASGTFAAQVGRNTTASLTSTGTWPSNCQVIWGTNRPSIIKVLGADAVYEVCDTSGNNCTWYYAGKNATITGVAPGSADIFATVIGIGPDGKWRVIPGASVTHTWTVTNPTGLAEAPNDPMPNVHDDPRVSQVKAPWMMF